MPATSRRSLAEPCSGGIRAGDVRRAQRPAVVHRSPPCSDRRARGTSASRSAAGVRIYGSRQLCLSPSGGARFSITAPMGRAVARAITQIPDDAWVGIKYPHAIWDQEEDRWVSDAEVAEIAFTVFTSRAQAEHISARLVVRRVKRLNPKTVPDRQRRVAGPGRDRVQPHPRRRDPRLKVPRQGDHRHDPHPAHRRARPLRPPSAAAPTQRWPWQNPWQEMFTNAAGPPIPAT